MASTRQSRLGLAPGSGAKEPCTIISTSNITLSGEQTINGVNVTAGDRVLVGGQTDATANGIYVVAIGAWERATDWNDDSDVVPGILIPIKNASILNYSLYQVSFSGTHDIGTTEYTFSPIFGSADDAVDYGLITEAVDATDDYGALA